MIQHNYPPPLRHSDLLELLQRAQAGDIDARNTVVARNMGLVLTLAYRIVRTIRRPDLLDDLVQAGVAGYRNRGGLLRAIELFDPDREVRFSTYASLWIRDAMLDLSNDNIVTVGANLGRRISIQRVAERLRRELGRKPTSDEIRADYTARGRLPPNRATCEQACSAPLTFEPVDEGSAVADNESHPLLTRDQLMRLLSCLNDRERTVIELRYGLADGEARSLAAVGEILGLSCGRIHRIEMKALGRMRRRIRYAGT